MIYALNKIICKVLLLSITAMAVGCRSDLSEFGGTPVTPSEGVPTLGVTLSVGSTRAVTIPDKFEEGTGYENYLDIKNGDFRIYFFDNDNKYIATFIPSEKTFPSSPAATDFTYKFKGAIPSAVNVNNPFKLVVLANWGDGNYPIEPKVSDVPEGRLKLVAGVTTIEDLTTHTSAQFLKLSSPADGEEWLSDSRLIPFYGVRKYDLSGKPELADKLDSNGRLKEDVYIELSEELPLLRAMAKVEVILNNPHASFSNVELTRVNAKGFCPPYKADNWNFNYTDYFDGDRYDWDKNFVRGVHLTNGATASNKGAGTNDPEAVSIAFKKVNSRTVSGNVVMPEKWVAYVPEYKNIGVNDFTTIRVTLADPREPGSSPAWTNPTKDIYFAANGCTETANDVESNRFDIERNNIYRFTVEGMSTTLNCEVDIIPYTALKLEYEYGLTRDKVGDIVLSDSQGNIYDTFKSFFTDERIPKVEDMDGNIQTGPDGKNIPLEVKISSPSGYKRGEADYFARVMNNGKAEIWLKDKDGDRVLSNFDGDDLECFARLVNEMSRTDAGDIVYNTKAYKDKDGDIRIRHFSNHSTIVLDENKTYPEHVTDPETGKSICVSYKTKAFEMDGETPIEIVKKYPISYWENNNTGGFWYSRDDRTLENPSIETLLGIYNELVKKVWDDDPDFPNHTAESLQEEFEKNGLTDLSKINILKSWYADKNGVPQNDKVSIQFNNCKTKEEKREVSIPCVSNTNTSDTKGIAT